MDFLSNAMELEKKTIAAFRTLSSRCASHEKVHAILEMLIKDHAQHLKTLSRAQDQDIFALDDLDVFKDIRGQLEQIRSNKDTFSCDVDQLSLYREARGLVLKKQTLYLQARDAIRNPEGMTYLDRLIQEEHKQMVVLDNIIHMVERPENWLEDAEFSHLEEY